MKLDLYQLRAFHEAVRLGSYSEAARRLHVTQSAVSHAVAKLETSAGCTLVEWRSRRLTLTAEGEALRESCERVFAEIVRAEARLLGQSGELVRTFRVGAPPELGTTVLLGKLRPLADAHPWLHLDFHFADDLFRPLLRGDIDLAVDNRAHRHPELRRSLLFREKYAVVASPAFLAAHPLAGPRDLGLVPVLSTDKAGNWWNRFTEALPGRSRPELSRVTEINHLRGMVRAAQVGLGVALVPRYAVLDAVAARTLQLVFPRLPLPDDGVYLYQRASFAHREVNRVVAAYLASMDVGEFAGALAPP
jgi:DNA-binding transcriptional LysR family regulator